MYAMYGVIYYGGYDFGFVRVEAHSIQDAKDEFYSSYSYLGNVVRVIKLPKMD